MKKTVSEPVLIRRYSVAWTLVPLALAMVPHFTHLPPWITFFCVAIVAWRLLTAIRRWPMPGRMVRLFIIFFSVFGVITHYGTFIGRDPGVAMFIIMLGLKLLEMRTPRDVVVILLMSYFLVVTNFIYSQSIPMALFMSVIILLLTSSLIEINLQTYSRPAFRLRYAATLLGQALPIMLVLFLFFPRINLPYFSFPGASGGATTGLSDTMAPGQISSLSESDNIAFRAQFIGSLPAKEKRYWRGPVLWNTDGVSWSMARADELEKWRSNRLPYEPRGQATIYTVTLEAHSRNWLFALDLPASAPETSFMTPDYQLQVSRPVVDRTQYIVSSYLEYQTGELNEKERALALRLPNNTNPQTRALAQHWKQRSKTNRDIVNTAMRYFSESNFIYTLTPPTVDTNPVDDFLFRTRSGFCGHFASSFATLMRGAGVPARIITGYQGGTLEPSSNQLVIKQKEAHTWVEVWLSGDGWKRIDPTAIIAPGRVNDGIEEALNNSRALFNKARMETSLFDYLAVKMENTRDWVNKGWNQWVLGYDRIIQSKVLARFGIVNIDWSQMVITLVVIIGILITSGSYFLLRRGYRNSDPVRKAYQAFCNKLSRRGIRREPAEGPIDFARRAATLRPDLAEQIRQISNYYIALRYGSYHADSWMNRLQHNVRIFRP